MPQKTGDILNYPKRQRATQKRKNVYPHLLQAQVGPRSTLCNWLLTCDSQFENENSQSLKPGLTNASSQKPVIHLSPQKEKKVKINVAPWLAPVTAINAKGELITSSRSSLKIRIIVIYMKGLGLD